MFSQRVQDVAKYIQQQNREVYEQRGIIVGDPMDRGLRCVSFHFFAVIYYCGTSTMSYMYTYSVVCGS